MQQHEEEKNHSIFHFHETMLKMFCACVIMHKESDFSVSHIVPHNLCTFASVRSCLSLFEFFIQSREQTQYILIHIKWHCAHGFASVATKLPFQVDAHHCRDQDFHHLLLYLCTFHSFDSRTLVRKMRVFEKFHFYIVEC